MLSDFFNNQRLKRAQRRRAEVMGHFNIIEKDGSAYLVCGDTAIKRFDDNLRVNDVILELQRARQDAISFHCNETSGH